MNFVFNIISGYLKVKQCKFFGIKSNAKQFQQQNTVGEGRKIIFLYPSKNLDWGLPYNKDSLTREKEMNILTCTSHIYLREMKVMSNSKRCLELGLTDHLNQRTIYF